MELMRPYSVKTTLVEQAFGNFNYLIIGMRLVVIDEVA